jgi:fumarate reductase subunit D
MTSMEHTIVTTLLLVPLVAPPNWHHLHRIKRSKSEGHELEALRDQTA